MPDEGVSLKTITEYPTDIPAGAVRGAEAVPTVDVHRLIQKQKMPPRSLVCLSYAVVEVNSDYSSLEK